MTNCKHHTIMKGMCYDCGHIFTPLELSQIAPNDVVSMVHSFPDLLVRIEDAEEIGKRDIDRLLKQRKLVLIVDLDHTLVHARASKPQDQEITSIQLGSDELSVSLSSVHKIQIEGVNLDVAIRPRSAELLHSLNPFFEFHVFTLGTREYAHQIVKIIDPQNKYIGGRIRSRCDSKSPTSKEQEISEIFPSSENMVVILDDRRDVWAGVDSVVQVLPFFYFENAEELSRSVLSRHFTQNTIEKIYKYCGETSYFDRLCQLLVNYHQIFYKIHDNNVESLFCDFENDDYLDEKLQPDMKRIISVERSKILKGCRILFSGVIPVDSDITDSNEYLLATFLGAEISDNIDDPDITHLVTDGTSTHKVKKLRNNSSIDVVLVDWLYCCYYLNFHASEEDFKLEPNEPVIESHAKDDEGLPKIQRKRKSDPSPPLKHERKKSNQSTATLEGLLDDKSLSDILIEIENELSLSNDQSQQDSVIDNEEDYNLIKELENELPSGDECLDSSRSNTSNSGKIDQNELDEFAKKLDSYFQ